MTWVKLKNITFNERSQETKNTVNLLKILDQASHGSQQMVRRAARGWWFGQKVMRGTLGVMEICICWGDSNISSTWVKTH